MGTLSGGDGSKIVVEELFEVKLSNELQALEKSSLSLLIELFLTVLS